MKQLEPQCFHQKCVDTEQKEAGIKGTITEETAKNINKLRKLIIITEM